MGYAAQLRENRLFFSVGFEVVLGGVLGMLRGVKLVSVGQMRVVSGCFVVAVEMMPGGFVVVARSVLVVLRCLGMMMGCLAGHGQAPFTSH